MLNIIKSLLKQMIDNIDTGNSNISEEEQLQIVELLQSINRKDLSKIEAANYLGISRATFDNYVKNGWISEGTKRQGFKEKSWNKFDLEKFKNNDTFIRKKF